MKGAKPLTTTLCPSSSVVCKDHRRAAEACVVQENIMPRPRCLFVLIALFCFPVITLAQSSTATLSGTVEDHSGAIVAGAKIALVNAAQGSQRLMTSNSEGRFVFPSLPSGQYSVTATRQGFAPV